MSIVYAQEQALSVADYCAVLASTYMRDKRPLANPERVGRILAGSNMIVTARADGAIVGLARGMSDGEWVCYLADLAVHADHQRQGIGTGLLRQVKAILGPGMGVVLIAYPEAETYYRKAGLGEMAGFYIEREIRN
ncbi:MAG: GNAT family N-acetyltransferase [Hyphomicrobiales bacterium]|nr:MAG: GNAT family N-acetyltransferase [Hyphomicrobiales bacterium]